MKPVSVQTILSLPDRFTGQSRTLKSLHTIGHCSVTLHFKGAPERPIQVLPFCEIWLLTEFADVFDL